MDSSLLYSVLNLNKKSNAFDLNLNKKYLTFCIYLRLKEHVIIVSDLCYLSSGLKLIFELQISFYLPVKLLHELINLLSATSLIMVIRFDNETIIQFFILTILLYFIEISTL